MDKISKLLRSSILAIVFGFFVISASAYTTKFAEAAPCVMPCILNLPAAISSFGTTINTAATKATAEIEKAIGKNTAALVTDGQTGIIADRITYLQNFTMNFWIKVLRPQFSQVASQFSVLEAMKKSMIGLAMDGRAQNRVMMELQKEELKARRATRPSANVKIAATMAGGMGRIKAIKDNYNLAGTVATVERTSNQKKSDDTGGAASDEEDHSSGSLTDFKDRWNDYITRYCEVDENNGYSGCSEDQTYAAEDIDVSATLFSKETIDLTDEDVAKAVNDLVVNIAEPFVKEFVVGNVSESIEGRRAILDVEKYRAKRQVVYDAVNHIVSRRVPGSQLGQYIFEMRKDSGIGVDNIGANPSYNEIMHVMTSERFRNGRYAIGQVDEPENNQRERVIQSAYYLMQLDDIMEVMDKQALLLTAQISEEINSSDAGAGSNIESTSSEKAE